MFDMHTRVCTSSFFESSMTNSIKTITKFPFPGSKAYHIMRDLKQTTTLPYPALESFLLKNTTATMVSPGQGGVTCLSSLHNLHTSQLTHTFLKLAAAPSGLACISFTISILSITIASKEMSYL